ncbi:hypothetical protein NST12_10825 [Bacillus sp. FSL W8-1127]|uniref:hypothetical protein n=1 Tax=Bacillus TaxID=1386 RepID=UPI0030F7C77B
MYKNFSIGLWIIAFLMIIFSENPNGYLFITLWLIGAFIGYVGKRKDKKSLVLNHIAMWGNLLTVIIYILWVFVVGVIWNSP